MPGLLMMCSMSLQACLHHDAPTSHCTPPLSTAPPPCPPSTGGVRIGTPAMTSRGLKEKDFEQVADFLHEVAQVRVELGS